MLLTIAAHCSRLTGTLVLPKHATEDWLGEFSGISLPIRTRPLKGQPKGDGVEVVQGPKSDQDRVFMRLSDRNHLLFANYRGIVPDWQFERVSGKEPIEVSSDWPAHNDDPKIVEIQQQLQAMAQQHKAAREKRWIHPKETTELAEQAGPFLESIFKQYGWPKISVFNVMPCNNFWNLVQHQPPAIQKEMLPALKKVVDVGETSKTNYAYLFDRVQTDEGKPQHWGTQAKCENGRAVLYPIDDMTNLNQRRKAVGLGTLDESLLRTRSAMSPGAELTYGGRLGCRISCF